MKNFTKRIEYLESCLPKGEEKSIETKHWPKFEKNACYLGNGVYEMQGLKARDTRVLFLKFCLTKEGIKFKEEDD